MKAQEICQLQFQHFIFPTFLFSAISPQHTGHKQHTPHFPEYFAWHSVGKPWGYFGVALSEHMRQYWKLWCELNSCHMDWWEMTPWLGLNISEDQNLQLISVISFFYCDWTSPLTFLISICSGSKIKFYINEKVDAVVCKKHVLHCIDKTTWNYCCAVWQQIAWEKDRLFCMKSNCYCSFKSLKTWALFCSLDKLLKISSKASFTGRN